MKRWMPVIRVISVLQVGELGNRAIRGISVLLWLEGWNLTDQAIDDSPILTQLISYGDGFSFYTLLM
jgi:hypothetical protein